MSLTAAIIDALLDTGATREQIAAAAKADIAERLAIDAARVEAKRKGNRERQQRKRAGHAQSRPVTRVTRDPPIEDILTPEVIPTKPSGLEPKPKKHRLPIDWSPEPFKSDTMAFRIVNRWEPGRMERELAKYRAHYAAAGTKWENWQAVWCKWVNNSDDFQRGRNGGQQQHHSHLGKSGEAFASLNLSDERPF